jgi:shikimate dehydrogenase/3-dehydroquinate dehydratase type I
MFPGPLCVSLTPRRVEEVFERDLGGADCLEVRLDYLGDPASADSVRWDRLPVPVIATCRRVQAGGEFQGTEEAELRVLEQAARNGARWIDLDYRLARPVGGVGVIASVHDFSGTPSELVRLAEEVCARPAVAAKVAVMTGSWSDVSRLLALGARRWPKPLIAVGMGEKGQMTRVIGPSRGSALTYASASDGEASAPGQLSISELLGIYRFRGIRPSTSLLGIVGNPVGHSASPGLHNRAIDRTGLDYVYLRLPVDSLEDFFGNARDIGIVGFSVTIPHKVAILPFLDRISPEAAAVGAVNTVTWQDGEWVGDNTDVFGIRRSLGDLDPSGLRVVVLGTGGAARAAVAALRDAKSITLLSRSRGAGRLDWARSVDVDRLDRYDQHPADLLINATPVGMHPNVSASPVSGPILAEVVFDMVYNPEKTLLLRQAEAQGKRTISGRTMLLAQAARQFEIWTGRAASPGLFSGAA